LVMIFVTKIITFEMAHAIDGYHGPCNSIHGHSYELHVTVYCRHNENAYIPAPGFVIDFKELKSIMEQMVKEIFDHKIILSKAYLEKNKQLSGQPNLIVWSAEPTAENILLFISKLLREKLPQPILLRCMKLYETKNSYAEWASEIDA